MVDEMDSPPMKKTAKARTKRHQGELVENTVARTRRLQQAVTDALDKRDQQQKDQQAPNPAFLLPYRPPSRTPEDEQSFLMTRLQETIGILGAGDDKENI